MIFDFHVYLNTYKLYIFLCNPVKSQQKADYFFCLALTAGYSH